MRPLRIVLVCINAGLIVAFWSPVIGSSSADSAPDPYLRTALSPLPPAIPLPDREVFSRLLFRAAPPAVAEGEADPDASSSPSFRLLGVILTGAQRSALVEHGGTTIRVGEGDELDGWLVRTIEARAIRLENAEQQTDLLLDPPVGSQEPHQ